MPRVSVIVPVFNGVATVGEALAGVLVQSYRDFELIVVDDGSTDATPQLLASYGGSITLITRANGGIAAARNSGLRAATGEYIALLDCDDVWLPTMLERTVATLDAAPQAVLAYTDLAITDSDGRALETALVGPQTAHAPTLDEMLTRLWPIMPSAVVIRRRVLEAIGGFAEEFRSYGYEDAWCWMRARELGEFCYLPEQLVKWRFSSYPRPLKSFSFSPMARKQFARMVQQRWGRSVEPLLHSRMRASRSLLGYIGLRELRDGNRRAAREAFRRALLIDPCRLKNYLRWGRTWLPKRIARVLGGRTTRAVDRERLGT
jgi:glycosyltransferase involved in cell wall biosynthesis